MEVTFTRSGERSYTTIARRDDGVTLRVPAFDHPTWIPHDLAHRVIEQALGLHHMAFARYAPPASRPPSIGMVAPVMKDA